MHPDLQPANAFREREVRHLQPGDHHCHVFETIEQSLMVLVPFLADGLEAGDRCVASLAETPVEDAREALEEQGIDTEARITEGDLLLRSVRDGTGIQAPSTSENGSTSSRRWSRRRARKATRTSARPAR